MPGTLSTAGMPSSRETIAAWLCTRTRVAHHGDGAEEQRRPRRIGDRADEHVAGLELARVRRVEDDAGRPRRRAPADRDPADRRPRPPAPPGWDVDPQRPRGRIGDVSLEPRRRDALVEVALALAARSAMTVGEVRRVGDEVGELGGRDAEGQPDVRRPAALGGAPCQFVQHPPGAEVLQDQDVLGPLAGDRSLARHHGAAAGHPPLVPAAGWRLPRPAPHRHQPAGEPATTAGSRSAGAWRRRSIAA